MSGNYRRISWVLLPSQKFALSLVSSSFSALWTTNLVIFSQEKIRIGPRTKTGALSFLAQTNRTNDKLPCIEKSNNDKVMPIQKYEIANCGALTKRSNRTGKIGRCSKKSKVFFVTIPFPYVLDIDKQNIASQDTYPSLRQASSTRGTLACSQE